MKENKKISIITPSFNQSKFIERTIQSIINQNYPNTEYIIIDGGSTDESVEVIKKYEKNIHYWISEQDNGQTHAINKGLKKCTGDIIAYINSDDVYLPKAFEIVNSFFVNNPEYAMIYGNLKVIDEKNNILKTKQELNFDYIMGCLIGFGSIIPQPTVFFKREVLDKTGLFNENYNFAMDAEYWYRVAQSFKLRHIQCELAAFRLHTESKTNIHQKENTDKYANETLNLIKQSYESIPLLNIMPFRYSYPVRKLYHMKRIIKKILKGCYFA